MGQIFSEWLEFRIYIMISIGEASEWVPHGREVVSKHPQFDVGKDDDLHLGVAGTTLLGDEELTCPGQESWRPPPRIWEFPHGVSTPQRPQNNGAAERAVRRVEGTRCCLLKSGHGHMWWLAAMRAY